MPQPSPTLAPPFGLRYTMSYFALATALLTATPMSATARTTAADADACQAMAKLSLPDVTIIDAETVTASTRHCVVNGRIGDSINFRVWLPEDWNGKFVMGGAGGFAGSIANQALFMGALNKGYATATTDTGHQAGALDGSWALNDLEAIVNYGHLAVHRVTAVTKRMVAEHYGRPADANYFAGCSNGGRQALQEAQRYPEDFDAILAGAPALSFDGVGSSFTYITQRMYPNSSDLSQPVLSIEERALLRSAIEEECDAADGITDGILNDPSSCTFDPQTLRCGAGEHPSGGQCLSDADLEVITAIYDGPKDHTGSSLYFGFPFGAEDTFSNGWGSWLVGRENGAGPGVPTAAYGFGIGLMRYFIYHDENWDYVDYDFSTYREDSAFVAATLDANDADLDSFRQKGGKLLLYHGWSDSALSAEATIDFVERVTDRAPEANNDVRLFLMPGVLHCAGGEGPSNVDWLDALDQWHTTGVAPSQLEASFPGGGGRMLCAWPKKAVFTGADSNDPGSFTCR